MHMGRATQRPKKINKDVARLAIVAAWPDWANLNLAGRAARDNDAHAFLRSVRAQRPELFTFKTLQTPHETAFFWLHDAGFFSY